MVKFKVVRAPAETEKASVVKTRKNELLQRVRDSFTQVKQVQKKKTRATAIPKAEVNGSSLPKPQWQLVTPKQAEAWLNKTNKKNRKLSKALYSFYANDMRYGRWRLNGAPIQFNKNNMLIDGQHRLQAIVEANVPQWFLVLSGMPESTQMVIDNGKLRTVDDVLGIMGYKGSKKTKVGPLIRAIVQQYHGVTGENQDVPSSVLGCRLSYPVIVECAFRLKRAVNFIVENFPVGVKSVTTTPVKAAIGRAYFTQNHTRLAEFCKILCDGQIRKKADGSALRLRQWLINSPTVRNGSAVTKTYLSTTAALRAFMKGEQVERLRGNPNKVFEIPKKHLEGIDF